MKQGALAGNYERWSHVCPQYCYRSNMDVCQRFLQWGRNISFRLIECKYLARLCPEEQQATPFPVEDNRLAIATRYICRFINGICADCAQIYC